MEKNRQADVTEINDTEVLISVEPCVVKLGEFEGPLDLLLHLVQEKKQDILNISVASIVDDYIRYLDMMKRFNIDVASEYLKMAAILIHLKSRALVADLATEDEDALAGNQNIIERMLIYRRFKDASVELSQRRLLMRDLFVRRNIKDLEAFIPEEIPIENVDIITLIRLYKEVCTRGNRDYTYELTPERVSVLARIYELVELFKDRETIRFIELFSPHETRIDIIVTFLAILEMARLRFVTLIQLEESDLYIKANLGDGIIDETIFRSADIEYK